MPEELEQEQCYQKIQRCLHSQHIPAQKLARRQELPQAAVQAVSKTQGNIALQQPEIKVSPFQSEDDKCPPDFHHVFRSVSNLLIFFLSALIL